MEATDIIEICEYIKAEGTRCEKDEIRRLGI